MNEFGQSIGDPVVGWEPRPRPAPVRLVGRTVSLEPLSREHAPDLYRTLVAESGDELWTYLFSGPFDDRATFDAFIDSILANREMLTFAVVVDGLAVGFESLMRIDAANGSIEVGNISLSDRLQRTTAATEVIALFCRHVFDDLGYRRFEWKCDALNARSRIAAERFGFAFEGVFRQAVVYKGRSRDTAWFAMTDGDWKRLGPAYDDWLDAANFDDDGRQRSSLRDLIAGRGSVA